MKKLTLEELEKITKETLEDCNKQFRKDLKEAGFLYVNNEMWERVVQAIRDEIKNNKRKLS